MALISNHTRCASSLILFAALIFIPRCPAWNSPVHQRSNGQKIQPRTLYSEESHNKDSSSFFGSKQGSIAFQCRRLFLDSLATASIATQLGFPEAAVAMAEAESPPNGVVRVRLESPRDTLGVEIYDTTLRGKKIVAIRKIVAPNQVNRFLLEGMVLRPRNGGDYSSKEFVERLRSGPYPLEVDFVNLAAGGDAISDLGTSIVTPKDALQLAQKTEGSATSTNGSAPQKAGYGITTLKQIPNDSCAIRSRRNDVLEIDYEASYVDSSGRKVVYDASAFRGTGTMPYQMVLGSGDVIPGVDQGLYDMCPGDRRLLNIPPVLGHGPNSRKLYKIPDDYTKLEWEVSLVSIDTTIKENNNQVSREDRESRFAY